MLLIPQSTSYRGKIGNGGIKKIVMHKPTRKWIGKYQTNFSFSTEISNLQSQKTMCGMIYFTIKVSSSSPQWPNFNSKEGKKIPTRNFSNLYKWRTNYQVDIYIYIYRERERERESFNIITNKDPSWDQGARLVNYQVK